MSGKTAICVAVILAAFGAVSGREQCNPYNFAVQGGYQCSLNWWNTTNVQDKITFTPKMSVETVKVLISHNISLTSINEALKDVAFNRPDPLSKLIESALVVEPYILYILADLLQGFQLTDSELQKLYLPPFLSNRQRLIDMYINYFNLHCSSNVLKPLVSCLTSWMNGNCDPATDKPQAMVDWMNNLIGFYCSNGVVKASIKEELEQDLGKVYSSAVKEVAGVYKDPNSPFIFDMSFNSQQFQTLSENYQHDCFPVINSSLPEFSLMVARDSSSGIGTTFERFMQLGKPILACSLTSVKKVYPGLLESSKPLIHHIATIGQQLGFEAEDFGITSSAGFSAYHALFGTVSALILFCSQLL